MTGALAKRISRLEQRVGTGGRKLYRWCESSEDAHCQLDEMKANGELKDGDTVQFVRWLTDEDDEPGEVQLSHRGEDDREEFVTSVSANPPGV
jgi:hypothetical protein